ncbi:MAG: cysteine desulfurase family protein [Eubacterium sp.]|nr:cysteine desulfurase family protein [Eubacterium sp.]
MTEVYLDHAATTKLSKEALGAMLPYLLNEYGNPSSQYSMGERARKAVTKAREQIASTLSCSPEEIFFTSGGTEADNWAFELAVAGEKTGQILISGIEHPAVRKTAEMYEKAGLKVGRIPVDENGIVILSALEKMIGMDTRLVSVMTVNNEIGTIQPVEQIGKLLHQTCSQALFHTDAVQAYGHMRLDPRRSYVHLLSASAHKFGGPKGTGFLYVAEEIKKRSLLKGGGQERGMRAGTENVAGIVGMAAASSQAYRSLESREKYVQSLRDYLMERLETEIPFVRLNGSRTKRLYNNVNISFSFVQGKNLVAMLDMNGICCSGGSACSSNKSEASPVLMALGIPEKIAQGGLRISLGEDNTKEEMDYAVYCIKKAVQQLRQNNPLYSRFSQYNIHHWPS